MHCAASNIASGTGRDLPVTLPEPCPGVIINSYVLPLKCRRSLVSRPAVNGDRAGHSAGFASTGQPYAAALEVADRQSARYLRAGEATAAPTHFTSGECRLAAGGASAPA